MEDIDYSTDNFSIDTSSLVDKVEGKIIQLLTENKLKVGDSMPKEIELASSLGVSRTVIREALMRLKVRGMVESKKKKGIVVTSPDLVSVLEKSMKPEMLTDATLKDIFEMRLALEVGMADYIIKRVQKQDIEDLKNIVKQEERYTLKDLPEHLKSMFFNAEYEIAFHGKLYEITGNQTMKKFQTLLLPIFSYVHSNTHMLVEAPIYPDFVSHATLIKLIENGDTESLRKGMRNHLGGHFERVFV